MIESTDVGSLPLPDDAEAFIDGVTIIPSSPTKPPAEPFQAIIVKGFVDKLKAGLGVPNYPQFRDMNRMFLDMMNGVTKTKEGLTETGGLSLKGGVRCLPEIFAIQKSSKRIFEDAGSHRYQIRICLTGPYTLSSSFTGRDGLLFSRLGEAISQVIAASLFNDKYGSVSLVVLDEPVFGLLDDPLIDRGSESRELLLRAWETILQNASVKGAQTGMHLHSTADQLFWQADSLNIVESHVKDSLYESERTSKSLESTDKFLKASISITNFDQLIGEAMQTRSHSMLSESAKGEAIAKTWKSLKSGELDPNTFLETAKLLQKRLIKLVNRFGIERLPYAGPECGLRSFPTYKCALESLRRVSSVVNSANREDGLSPM